MRGRFCGTAPAALAVKAAKPAIPAIPSICLRVKRGFDSTASVMEHPSAALAETSFFLIMNCFLSSTGFIVLQPEAALIGWTLTLSGTPRKTSLRKRASAFKFELEDPNA